MKARLENIIDHIRGVPRTVPQIAADLSLPRTSVHRYVLALHLRKMVHIDGWDSAGAKYAPSFLAGAGEDTPRPMRKIERQRDARKHTPIVVLDDNDEAPISPCKPAGTVTVTVRRDPLVAALFGNPIRGGETKQKRDPLMAALFGDAA